MRILLTTPLVFLCILIALTASCQSLEKKHTLEFPPPTASTSKLLKPLGSQKTSIKSVTISYECFRAVEKSVDVYNFYNQQHYEKYKDIDKHMIPPGILGENERVSSLTCNHYSNNKLGVSISTQYPQTIHVIFDKDLTILSWAFGDINRP